MSLYESEKTRSSNSHLRYNVPLRNTRTKIRSNFSPEPNHPHDESKNSLPNIQQKPVHRLIQSRNASFVISKTQETDLSMRSKDKSPLKIIRHNRSVTPFDEGDSRDKSFGDNGKKKEYASILEGQIKERDEIKIQEKLKEKELEKIVQQGDYFYRRFGKNDSIQNENKKVRPLLKKLEKYHSTSTIHDFSSVKERTMTDTGAFETMMTTQGTQDGMNTMSSVSKFQRTEHSPESTTMSIRRRVRTEDGGEEERMKDHLKKMEYKKMLDMQMLEKKMKKKKEEELLAHEEKMDYLKNEYHRLMAQVAQPPKYIPKIEDPDRNISYDSKNLTELSKILEMYKPPKRGGENSGSPMKTDMSTGRTQGAKQKLGALDETIKRRTMKHSYSTADETNNSPNYASSSSQSINRVLGAEDLTTISYSKLEAMSAHLKKVVQTIGTLEHGKGEENNNNTLRSYNTLPHLERSTEKKKPVKLVLTKGNTESKKIGQLKKISQDMAIKKAYGLPGDMSGLTKAVEEGQLRRISSDGREQYSSLRGKSVEKPGTGDYFSQTGSFEKEIKKKDKENSGSKAIQKADVSGLQIVIPETPPSERETTTWQSVKREGEAVEEEILINDESEEEEKSVTAGGIFKKTKSTEVLKKPIKITVSSVEKSVVVLPEKQDKKAVGLEEIIEEEEEAQPATSNNLKAEEGKPMKLTFTFKQEEEQDIEVKQSERKVRKHSQDLVFNAQGQKRKRSELDEISVFGSGNIEKGGLGGDRK